MSQENSIFKRIGIGAAILPFIILSALFGGWADALMWGWFAVPIFELPPITLLQAIGLHLLIRSLIGLRHIVKTTDSDYTFTGMLTAILTGCGVQLFMLAAAYAIYSLT